MLKVNHLDNLERIYAPKDFLNRKFLGYKITYNRGQEVIEIPCFSRMQLRKEMISLFNKYDNINKTVNVIGILGTQKAIKREKS